MRHDPPQPLFHVPRTGGVSALPPLQLVFHCCTRLMPERRGAFRRHLHDRYELILVEQGPYHSRLRDEAVALQRGELLLVQPGDWHQDDCHPPLAYWAMQCDLLLAGRPVRVLRDGLPARACSGTFACERVVPQLQELCRLGRDEGPVTGLQQDAAASALFWQLLAGVPAEHLAPWLQERDRDRRAAGRLRALIEQRLADPPSVSELARHMDLSERGLNVLCRRLFNQPPGTWLRHVRLDEAARLLLDGRPSLAEVAARTGFANAFHFSRAFRQRFGRSPSSFRNG